MRLGRRNRKKGVQIVNNNALIMKATGIRLINEYLTQYSTPCAAYYQDLILEVLGSKINKESSEWQNSRWEKAKNASAKELHELILSSMPEALEFWQNVDIIMSLLVSFFRFIDRDDKPTMPYIYMRRWVELRLLSKTIANTIKGIGASLIRDGTSTYTPTCMLGESRSTKSNNKAGAKYRNINNSSEFDKLKESKQLADSFTPIDLDNIFDDDDPINVWLLEKE
ncbi:hypothetical protein Cgig2_013741 [Carnegiea gigantea]|uniref:Uncharacterized protein n=1 Tax=Carnegiea gigantea TaxID=171969 RepID=A0A9Q1JW66_9CARY|nr:hypothetical protein Cgig2_013741 [Carnegiea gigantea]